MKRNRISFAAVVFELPSLSISLQVSPVAKHRRLTLHYTCSGPRHEIKKHRDEERDAVPLKMSACLRLHVSQEPARKRCGGTHGFGRLRSCGCPQDEGGKKRKKKITSCVWTDGLIAVERWEISSRPHVSVVRWWCPVVAQV